MHFLEPLTQNNFSRLAADLDAISPLDINATIPFKGKQWNVLHFLAEAAVRGSGDYRDEYIDVGRLTMKALDRGIDIHRGDSDDGKSGDTPFNILAPSNLPVALR